MIDERTLQRIKTPLELLGDSCRNLSCILTQRSLTASAFRIETINQKYFVKIADPGFEEMIHSEYEGLKKLADTQCVRTPVIYCYQEWDDANPPFLLLEWIENHAGGEAAGQTKLGEQLATLHDASADLQSESIWIRER